MNVIATMCCYCFFLSKLLDLYVLILYNNTNVTSKHLLFAVLIRYQI